MSNTLFLFIIIFICLLVFILPSFYSFYLLLISWFPAGLLFVYLVVSDKVANIFNRKRIK